MTNLRLATQPIPATSRLASLANLLPQAQWDRVRRAVYRRAAYRCQACGRPGRLHCHELWQFNPHTSYQHLAGFRALCGRCHQAAHVTFCRDPARRQALAEHFMTVNRLGRPQAEAYLRDAYRRQRELDLRVWTVSYGPFTYHVPATRTVQERRCYADRR